MTFPHRCVDIFDYFSRGTRRICGTQDWPAYHQIISAGANCLGSIEGPSLILRCVCARADSWSDNHEVAINNRFANDSYLLWRGDDAVESAIGSDACQSRDHRWRVIIDSKFFPAALI